IPSSAQILNRENCFSENLEVARPQGGYVGLFTHGIRDVEFRHIEIDANMGETDVTAVDSSATPNADWRSSVPRAVKVKPPPAPEVPSPPPPISWELPEEGRDDCVQGHAPDLLQCSNDTCFTTRPVCINDHGCYGIEASAEGTDFGIAFDVIGQLFMVL